MIRAGFHGRSALRRGFIITFGLLGSLAIATPAFAQKDQKTRPRVEFVPDEYVVQLKKPLGEMTLKSASSMVGAPVIDRIQDDIVLVRAKEGGRTSDIIRALEKRSAVARVEPNYIYRISRVPNDPGLSQLWGLKNTGGLDKEGTRGLSQVDIGAEKAWEITTGSKDILVAVIDTGVDYAHEDLSANAWVNELEKNGQPGVDDDGNGYVDDIYGYDFANDDADPMDDNGHGTHCAGTIGATGNDGRGLVGVNWNVSIMGIKFLTAAGGGTLANAIKSINYATLMGAHVMNNSWGGGAYSEILKETIVRSRRAGVVFVAAAGNSAVDNDDAREYPASYAVDNIISVAAIDNRGDLASFSNYGAKSVHVAAPGHHILSTVPSGTDVYSGTSMAAPHVSGIAALMLAYNKRLSYDEIKERLIRTSKPLWTLKGRVVSGGVVDAFNAMTNILALPDANDPTKWINRREEIVQTPHPYMENMRQTWTITVPGAKRISLFFKKFDTEANYDKLRFLNAAGESLGTWSGKREERYSPIADGDTIRLEFTADRSVNGYGFEVEHITFE